MNTKTLKASIAVVSLVAGMAATSSAMATVPRLEALGKGAISECPTIASTAKSQVYHSDKIVFMIGQGNLQPLIAADFAALNALPRLTELDIKIRDNPAAVADIKAKVLSFMGAANTLGNRDLLKITDVEYTAVVCPKAP